MSAPACEECATPVLYTLTADGWQWVALHIGMPDRRRYYCQGGTVRHTR